MTSEEHKLSCNCGLEVIVTFFNDVDQDAGQWHNVETSNGNEDEEFNCSFPSLHKIFGIHKDAMSMFLLETNCLKKEGNTYIINAKGHYFLMSIADVSSDVETTVTRLSNKKGNRRFVKIGNTSLTPAMIWDDYLDHPR